MASPRGPTAPALVSPLLALASGDDFVEEALMGVNPANPLDRPLPPRLDPLDPLPGAKKEEDEEASREELMARWGRSCDWLITEENKLPREPGRDALPEPPTPVG